VITRGQSERGKYAAAIAGKIYQALGGNIKRNRDLLYARQLKIRPATDSGAADEGDEGEDADMADNVNDNAPVEQAPIVVGSQQRVVTPAVPQPETKKMVQKTAQSRPTFNPVVIEFDKSGAEKGEKATRPRVVKNK